MRIDIQEPSKSLVELLEAALSGIEGVNIVLSEEEEYRLSGRDVVKFLAISMAAGIIGNTAYADSKSLIDKVVTAIADEAKKANKPINFIVDGIHHAISSEREAEVLVKELTNELLRK